MKLRIILLTLLAVFCLVSAAAAGPSGATTELHLLRIAENGTVLEEKTIDYQWMEANLPVQGDGSTHYYHQGPVFTDELEGRWDVNETGNFKDRGAVKGTAVKDLCDLIGGMTENDDVMIVAVDGYHVEYGYSTIYEPPARQGPATVCWYVGEDVSGVGERQGVGYPGKEGYFLGMRLVFLADDSVNPEGLHVFGNNDMRETLPEKSVYFYEGLYPSTSGLTVKWVSEIRVYEGGYTGETGVLAKSMTTQTPVPTKAASSPLFFGSVIAGMFGGVLLRRRS
ncbi:MULTISPECIES: hypothetical protein [Methanocorpusculum]|jgi:hypothetical protein|uniref:Argininosuccinate synthase n=1 Tax=Methanocorpusculum parvum TaxID=2193 RepID=A0AAX0Q8X5_9EURY|nr:MULTISPECIES: hypothetical protein [Methanocorpusculum]MDD2248145.1 argininosuccinate synthase [Methanocorpusculum sp.]MDD2802679.1 argininosuccinate synthase [Methanocorpusculum sp.]MDD3911951.1 argininosuccinate synthase [Methanocorpusculum sp.]MDD4423108.1 argininosuccinate synthase [Methanocorpusculum parvum]MDY3201761.1 argininosuccinate synthase [Methanocorpusculum sp.]